VTKAKTLSIVIPAYNEEHHLPACLDAIAAQTVKPDEVIVVDNNSTDKTAEIAKNYPFVTLLRESKQGRVYARNRGFDAVRSDIIGRIDADTILPDNWIEREIKFYQSKSHFERYAYTGGVTFYNIRLPRFNSWVQGQWAFRTNRFLLGHYILFGSNMSLPRSLWLAVRSQVCLRTDIHEDLDLSIHLHRLGYNITYHAGHEVGIQMRRVRSGRNELMVSLMLWPTTLRVHDNRRWIFGWLGAVFLYYASYLLIFNEWIARLFGKVPLPE
jgi:glycosyltransferase involved in cell wall biosynthesis